MKFVFQKENPKKMIHFLSRYKYWIIGIVFLIWMLFLDTNSYLINYRLQKELNELESQKEFYQTEIQNDKQLLEELENDTLAIERFAREKYYMKKKNEDIFIIDKKSEEKE